MVAVGTITQRKMMNTPVLVMNTDMEMKIVIRKSRQSTKKKKKKGMVLKLTRMVKTEITVVRRERSGKDPFFGDKVKQDSTDEKNWKQGMHQSLHSLEQTMSKLIKEMAEMKKSQKGVQKYQ